MKGNSKISYRQIFKATSIFGGVKVITIFVAIVRTKIIAVLLGPLGMGISGLYTSSLNVFALITGFGLDTTAVREISSASASNEKKHISEVVATYRILVWLTGFLGLLSVVFMSGYLSRIVFGNAEYTWAFVTISVTLLLNKLASGHMVLLQSLQKIKSLAKVNILSSVFGLLISFPVYFFYGVEGIVPVIIMTSVFGLVVSAYFGRKINIEKVKISINDFFIRSKGMIRLGIVIGLSTLVSTGSSYFLRIFISQTGSVEQVGLYAAGSLILNKYVGLVFSAMGTDYFPRLSKVAGDDRQSTILINQQSEIAILIIGPILAFFLIFVNLIIILMYSDNFLQITNMIKWMAVGMYAKSVAWAIAFVFLAKGNSKLFFWNEFFASLYTLSLNILCYNYWGLEGLGVSVFISYLIYCAQVYVIANLKYKYLFSFGLVKIVLVQFIIGVLCFLLAIDAEMIWQRLLGISLPFLSVAYSFIELNKRIDIRSLIKR